MKIKNSYPEKPIVKFFSKKIEMADIINIIKSLNYSNEVKKSAYVIIRNETSNGNSVINGTNPCGAQSDSGRWQMEYDDKIVATCIKNENMTGRERGFVVFDTLSSGISFLCDRIISKGIFIGENVDGKYFKGDVRTPQQEADAYEDEWVYGENHNTTPIEIKNFVSMYNQANKIFS